MTAEKLLKLVLRTVGIVSMTALFPALMPFSWMQWVHQKLGMGDLPDLPIVQYLARSTSGLYALLGMTMVLAASDPVKYRGLILLQGLAMFCGGIFLGLMDWSIGMPRFWATNEPVVVITLGVIILGLYRMTLRSDSPAPSA